MKVWVGRWIAALQTHFGKRPPMASANIWDADWVDASELGHMSISSKWDRKDDLHNVKVVQDEFLS